MSLCSMNRHFMALSVTLWHLLSAELLADGAPSPFPYEWTYAERIVEDGRPIQRPLGLAYPGLGEHPSDEYLFGNHLLLVAPVVERGARERRWSGERQQGGRVGSYATDPGVVYVRVALGPRTPFELFDGAVVTQEAAGETLELSWRDGSELAAGAVFEVMATDAPSAVREGATELAELGTSADLESAEAGWRTIPSEGSCPSESRPGHTTWRSAIEASCLPQANSEPCAIADDATARNRTRAVRGASASPSTLRPGGARLIRPAAAVPMA